MLLGSYLGSWASPHHIDTEGHHCRKLKPRTFFCEVTMQHVLECVLILEESTIQGQELLPGLGCRCRGPSHERGWEGEEEMNLGAPGSLSAGREVAVERRQTGGAWLFSC